MLNKADSDSIEFNFEEYLLIGDNQFKVAIDKEYTDDFIEKILTAIKAYRLDCTSMDYVYKKYIKNNFEPIEFDGNFLIIKKTFQYIRINLGDIISRLQDDSVGNASSVGHMVARATLARLENSFRSAMFLIRQQYYYEAMSICRLILEQIAWSYEIYELNEEKIMKTKPTKSISKLKELMPFAGLLYGDLSSRAHISVNFTPNHIKISKDYNTVVLGNPIETLESAKILLELADILGIVFEVIFKNYLKDFIYISEDTHNSKSVYRLKENTALLIDELDLEIMRIRK